MENKIILTDETSVLNVLKIENGLEQIKNEFSKVVEFSSKLEITDFDDKKQYEIVKSNKQGFVKTRNTVKRAFKSKRDINTEENRKNLEAEREVLSVIEKEEKRLDEMLEKADKLKLRKENEAKLESRISELSKYEYVENNETLLEMKDKEFDLLLSGKRELYLEKKEAELKAEQERIAREKEIEEAKKQAKLEAEQEAERQAELERQRVEREKQEAKEKAEKDRLEAERKQKEELERVEREKQNEIARIKREQEEKERQEKLKKIQEEQERIKAEQEAKKEKEILERRKEYQKWRESFGFNELLKNDFIEQKENGKIILFKKVGEFNI